MDYLTLGLCILYTATVFFTGKWLGFRKCRKIAETKIIPMMVIKAVKGYHDFLVSSGVIKR